MSFTEDAKLCGSGVVEPTFNTVCRAAFTTDNPRSSLLLPATSHISQSIASISGGCRISACLRPRCRSK